jgi:hypothetical protein
MIGTHVLVAEAERADCVIELVPALGAFVPSGRPLFSFTVVPRNWMRTGSSRR